MEIIAHRGASHDAPENTLAAVNLGWQQGADGVEVDVHCSKDGHVVVIHDEDTRKTTGVKKRVREQVLAELRQLDAGGWKAARWTGERVPTLEQVLATVPDGKRLFVEIKCGPECIDPFVKLFQRSGREPRQVVPIGFSLETMQRLKRALPQLETALVSDFKRTLSGRWTPTARQLVRLAKEAGLDGMDVSGRGPVDAKFADEVHRAGLKLYIWTVDAPGKAKQLRAAGVDGITTNRPGWLREQLAAK